MRALKLQVEISNPSQLVVDLPPGVARGRAELILLTPDEDVEEPASVAAMRAHLQVVLQAEPQATRDELDERIAAERAAWD